MRCPTPGGSASAPSIPIGPEPHPALSRARPRAPSPARVLAVPASVWQGPSLLDTSQKEGAGHGGVATSSPAYTGADDQGRGSGGAAAPLRSADRCRFPPCAVTTRAWVQISRGRHADRFRRPWNAVDEAPLPDGCSGMAIVRKCGHENPLLVLLLTTEEHVSKAARVRTPFSGAARWLLAGAHLRKTARVRAAFPGTARPGHVDWALLRLLRRTSAEESAKSEEPPVTRSKNPLILPARAHRVGPWSGSACLETQVDCGG